LYYTDAKAVILFAERTNRKFGESVYENGAGLCRLLQISILHLLIKTKQGRALKNARPCVIGDTVNFDESAVSFEHFYPFCSSQSNCAKSAVRLSRFSSTTMETGTFT